jgi:predicted nucleic acid-binding protein
VTYLDTSIIVPAFAEFHPNHAVCAPLVAAPDSVTSAHTLAETFSVLTKVYKFDSEVVATVLATLPSAVRVEPIAIADYFDAMAQSKARRIIGGRVYDALHLAVARRLQVQRVLTFNVGDFTTVAPDLVISSP